MEKPRPSTVAWGVILAGISAYEMRCPQGETLSERLDPLLEKRWQQALVLGVGAVVTAHLANSLPHSIDPFEQGLSRVRQAYKRRTV